MKKRACIYCGTTEDLSVSDIIPDALTNAKILNPNVCRIAHNNKFSDMFEDEIIKSMALITNELDIKSSKGKKYATYTARITIDGTEYTTNISSDAELFGRKRIISTENGKTKLGPLEQIKKFKGATDENVSIVDVNQIEIEKRVTLKLDVFFSIEMHRLMAKIAYEWYCLYNNITDKLDVFDSIIDFITTGNSFDPVELVSNEAVYAWFEQQSDFGSHTILSYIGLDDSVNIIVSFFGIAVYNIRLLSHPIDQCKYNAVYQRITIDAKREQFCFYSMADLIENFRTAFHEVEFPGGVKVMVPQNMDDTSLQYQMMYAQCYEMFQNDLMCVTQPTPQVFHLLKQRMENILQISALTVRGLKRFVKEHKEYLNTGFGLNPNGSNKRSIFMFYILFIVGKSEGVWKGLENVNDFIKEKFGADTISVSDELSNQLLLEMLETEGYFETIKAGAVAIENWKYE